MQPQAAEDIRRYVAFELQSRLKAIDELNNELISLRRLHNSVAPIQCLPPEVFSAVFEHLRNEEGDITDVINVTHVCKLWREVALQAAMLWSAFHINSIEVTKAFLERSRLEPLKLHLTEPRDPIGRIAELVAPHVGRLRVLRLYSAEEKNMTRLLDRFVSEAPLLEELVVKKNFRRHRVITINQPIAYTSLPRLFGGSLPCDSLRILKVRDISLLPSFSRPSVLVNFDIHQPSGRFSVQKVLRFLQNCPLLERVCIASMSVAVGEATSGLPSGLPLIDLPRLQNLIVVIAPGDMLQILSGLSVPRTVRVRLETLYAQPGAGGYDDFIPTDKTNLPFFSGVERLEVYLGKHRIIARGFHSVEAQVEAAFEIKILIRLGMPPLLGYLAHWPFDLLKVKSLVIVGPRAERAELGFGALCRFMAQFPSLKDLCIVAMNSANAKTLFQVLRTDGDPMRVVDLPEDHSNAPFNLCRRLRTLELCDLVLDEAAKKPLLEIVGRRAKGGGELRNLHLSLVEGWAYEDAEQAMELGEGFVTISMDACE